MAGIEEEIARLKEIYNRPKAYNPVSQYSQQHLKQFTLGQELTKQREHLALHILQHSTLKGKAGALHKQIKQVLPKYAEGEQQKGMKPLSYGEFRQNALAEKRQR